MAENSNDAKIISLYIKCLCELNKFEDIEIFLNSLSDTLATDQLIQKEISESQFNAMRYNTEEIYQQVLDLKTIKYILEEL